MQKEPGSITRWLTELKAGQTQAAEPIWNRYQAKLVAIASKQLARNTDPAVDGEDLVQNSFSEVCIAMQNGKYPDTRDREDLWGLLFVAVINRVRQHYRGLSALKRSDFSPRQVIDLSTLEDLRTPFAAAQTAELLEYLLSRLDLKDPSRLLRQIAVLYLDEHSASSIARLLRKRKTSILVSLRLIRSIWEEHKDL